MLIPLTAHTEALSRLCIDSIAAKPFWRRPSLGAVARTKRTGLTELDANDKTFQFPRQTISQS